MPETNWSESGLHRDAYDLPVYEKVMEQYGHVTEDIRAGRIMSAYVLDRHGLAAAFAKMAFGNKMGVKVDPSLSKETLFETGFGEILAEVKADSLDQLQADYERCRYSDRRAGSGLR